MIAARSESKILWRAGWLGWSLCALSLVLTLLALWLFALSYNVDSGGAWSGRGALTYFFIFSVVGALIVSRQPRQSVGWVFCWMGLANAFMSFAKEYAIYSLLTPSPALAGGELMAWLRSWLWVPGTIAPLTLTALLFPSGRLPSRRWRPVLWLLALTFALMSAAAALLPGPLSELSFVENPVGIAGTAELFGAMLVVGMFISAGALLAGVGSLVQRLRRATGYERKQLQWLAFAALLLALALPLGILLPDLGASLILGASLSVPIAVGIAILRYRLFDIDILIRRTLIYSLLTLALLLVYFASVVVFQRVAVLVSNQQQSELVTVVSTLLIAALFVPLRQRVQSFIDQRFYRRKYNAARTLEQFGMAVRDEVNLDELRAHILAVVQETMQPSTASLWLRSSRKDR